MTLKSKSYELLVIGGGSAGFAGAIRAIELGAKKVLVVEEGVIGGTCLNRGCIPSKYLIEVAKTFYTPKSNPFLGVKLQGGELNLEKVVELKEEILKKLRREKYWDVVSAYGIEYLKGHGELLGDSKAKVRGEEVSFDKCLIATGSRPSVPPIKGIKEVPYLTSDNIFDLKELPEHLIVIGGGAVGLELGQAFLRLGSKVSLIEALPDIAFSHEPEIRQKLREILEREGMEIYTSARVEEVSREGERVKVKILLEGEEAEILGTHLLVATGRKPNTDNLGLERAKVLKDEKGFLKVNEYLQTTNENIYGAGDCVGKNLLVTLSALEGGVAVENAFLGNKKKVDYLSVPSAIFTEPEVGSVGLTQERAEREGFKVKVRVLELSKVPRAVISLKTEGLVKMVVEEGTNKILGVSLLSPQGAEIIQKVVPFIKYKLRLEDLIETVDVYPTFSEAIKLCALSFFKDVSRLSCCAQ